MHKSSRNKLIAAIGLFSFSVSALLIWRINEELSNMELTQRKYDVDDVPFHNDSAGAYEHAADDYVDETIEDELESGSNDMAGIDLSHFDIVIGDGEDEISRKSDEYRELINEYYGYSLADEDISLVLYGKTNGLGARGEVTESEGVKGRIYNAADIAKLRNKMRME